MKHFISIACMGICFGSVSAFAESAKIASVEHSVYLLDDSGDNYVMLRAPAAMSSNYAFSLPATAGVANQVLATDGVGNTDWISALINPMTSTGDIVYSADNSGTPARLGVGSSSQVLIGGTSPSYSQINSTNFFTSGAVVQPGTAPGLVSASGVPGSTTGSSIAAGCRTSNHWQPILECHTRS